MLLNIHGPMSMPIDILISSDATEIDGGGDPTNVDTD
jgi:hypothetical protein